MSAAVGAMPAIMIPDTMIRNGNGYPEFRIVTPHGPIEVEVGRCQELWCVGTPEAVIGYGLTRPEWLPGLPGNNSTSQRVVFESEGPRLILGKPTGKRPKKQMRIIVEGWGFIKRTVRVRIPLTESQLEQIDAWIAREDQEHEERRNDRKVSRPAVFDYRAEGNVIHVRFPTAAREGVIPQ